MQVQIGNSIPGEGNQDVFLFRNQLCGTVYGDDIRKSLPLRIDRDQLNFVNSGFERYHERIVRGFWKTCPIRVVRISGSLHPLKLVVNPYIHEPTFER